MIYEVIESSESNRAFVSGEPRAFSYTVSFSKLDYLQLEFRNSRNVNNSSRSPILFLPKNGEPILPRHTRLYFQNIEDTFIGNTHACMSNHI